MALLSMKVANFLLIRGDYIGKRVEKRDFRVDPALSLQVALWIPLFSGSFCCPISMWNFIVNSAKYPFSGRHPAGS